MAKATGEHAFASFNSSDKEYCSSVIGRHFFALTQLLLDRSPWSNEYDPPLDDGTVPSPKLRKLEITANEAFDTYREM